MNQEKQTTMKKGLKYIVFSLVPLMILLLAATGVLRFLEKRKIAEFQRTDDRVASPPTDLLAVEKTSKGSFYKIQDFNMKSSVFPVEKGPGTYRIFVVGGSFAMGTPYVHQLKDMEEPGYGGIPDWLGAELGLRYPSLDVQVVNCGAGAQNSTRVYWIVRELLKAGPDLFIVLTGNNEGYVPATSFNEDLQRWTLYRALKKAILPETDLGKRSYFSPQDEDSKKIEAVFQGNIRRIVTVIKDHDIDLMLATMPINLKYNDFDVSVHGRPTPFPENDENITKGKELHLRGKYKEALEQFAASPNQAFACYFIARSMEALGRFEEAGEFYKIFVQNNPLNRTRPSFNEFIRRIGREKNIPVADLEKALEDSSPNGIPSPRLFHDYCHMTWAGYQFMAGLIVEKIIEAEFIRGNEKEPLPEPDVETMIKVGGWQKILQMP